MAVLLGVNVDHVATVRQARGTNYPSVVEAAALAEDSGADSITVHLREDRRHIQDSDVTQLCANSRTRVNLEMAVTGEMLGIALRHRPHDVCLVPEKRQELTTEGGLDVVRHHAEISAAVARLSEAGIRVSLFIDPDPEQLKAAKETQAPVIELHTGTYAELEGESMLTELARLDDACNLGHSFGLVINAGHGLNRGNVQAIASLPYMNELNIGHAIISRSIFVGLPAAVNEMRMLIEQA
ncbi:MAG TPA: pyridoxine 5'-phosphate synthase [Xanthomonadales bacterium]|nr:pyridoxine 5'-phosphate synthase [Xanthomonadales bacterium]